MGKEYCVIIIKVFFVNALASRNKQNKFYLWRDSDYIKGGIMGMYIKGSVMCMNEMRYFYSNEKMQYCDNLILSD